MSTPSEKLADESIRYASRFVGLREVRPNAAWDNPKTFGSEAELTAELREVMRPSPWEPGWAYCAAFVEAVIKQALLNLKEDAAARAWSKTVNAGVLASYNALRQLGLTTQKPVRGAIWYARHGSTSNGHCGLITAVDNKLSIQSTIEANTSLDSKNPAKDREGDWITTRIGQKAGRGSLRTLGYINPEQILSLK